MCKTPDQMPRTPLAPHRALSNLKLRYSESDQREYILYYMLYLAPLPYRVSNRTQTAYPTKHCVDCVEHGMQETEDGSVHTVAGTVTMAASSARLILPTSAQGPITVPRHGPNHRSTTTHVHLPHLNPQPPSSFQHGQFSIILSTRPILHQSWCLRWFCAGGLYGIRHASWHSSRLLLLFPCADLYPLLPP